MTSIPALAYYHNIKPVNFGLQIPQPEGIAWLMKALQHSQNGADLSEDAVRGLNLYERLLTGSAIAFRRTCLEDYGHQHWESMKLFRSREPSSDWFAPKLEERMRVFADISWRLIEDAYADMALSPAYGIQVSCTGYDAPTAMQKLWLQQNWHQTKLLHLGHMGCYAALPACHLGSQLLQSPQVSEAATVSLMMIELCTLHLRPAATDADQIVMNTLFADGAVRVDMTGEFKPGAMAHLGYHETILPHSLDKMTWRVADSAFLMTLNRRVPNVIRKDLPAALKSFLEPYGLSPSQIDHFAIHPGGPRIIESVADALQLDQQSIRHSVETLRQYGNMSSCTVPHIWHALREDPEVNEGAYIVSLAFGPGLTLAVNLMRKGR